MVKLDGSIGEGGGQILRTALTLSTLTSQPFEMDNIRSGRSKPGLRAQHLKCVDAAAAISKADVTGASLGSMSLSFSPREIRTGRYKFDIGTAGSTSLVLQTIFLPLSTATSASTVIISGGTHAPWAPCTHFLQLQWLRHLQKAGFDANISLDLAGFYPQGGGRITSTIRPMKQIKPLILNQRGELRSIHGISAISNLDIRIADRQKRQALRRLQSHCSDIRIRTEQLPSKYKGTLIILCAEFEPDPPGERYHCSYYGLGKLGKPAEMVADDAIDAILKFIETNATVDQFLADQLLLPLSLASGPSEFITPEVTGHLLTNAEIIRTFTPTIIEINGTVGEESLCRIIPSPFLR